MIITRENNIVLGAIEDGKVYTLENMLLNPKTLDDLREYNLRYTFYEGMPAIKEDHESPLNLEKFLTDYTVGSNEEKEAVKEKLSAHGSDGELVLKIFDDYTNAIKKLSSYELALRLNPNYRPSGEDTEKIQEYIEKNKRTEELKTQKESIVQENCTDKLGLAIPDYNAIKFGIGNIVYPNLFKYQHMYDSTKDLYKMTCLDFEDAMVGEPEYTKYKKRIKGQAKNNVLPIQENEQEYYDRLCALIDKDLEMSNSNIISSELKEYFETFIHLISLTHRKYSQAFTTLPQYVEIEEVGGALDSVVNSDRSTIDPDDENDPDQGEDETAVFLSTTRNMSERRMKLLGIDFKSNNVDQYKVQAKGLMKIIFFIENSASNYAWAEFITKYLRWGDRKPTAITLEGTDKYLDMETFSIREESGLDSEYETLAYVPKNVIRYTTYVKDNTAIDGLLDGNRRFCGIIGLEVEHIKGHKETDDTKVERLIFTIQSLVEELKKEDGIDILGIKLENGNFVLEKNEIAMERGGQEINILDDSITIPEVEYGKVKQFYQKGEIVSSERSKIHFMELGLKTSVSELSMWETLLRNTIDDLEESYAKVKNKNGRTSDIAKAATSLQIEDLYAYAKDAGGMSTTIIDSLEVMSTIMGDNEETSKILEKSTVMGSELSDIDDLSEIEDIEETPREIEKVVLEEANKIVNFKGVIVGYFTTYEERGFVAYHVDRVKEVIKIAPKTINLKIFAGNFIYKVCEAKEKGKELDRFIDEDSITLLMKEIF